MKHEGKVAFITGGIGGIGLAFGETLLREGAKVALVDLRDGKKTEEELQQKYGKDKVMVLQCDVTMKEQLRTTYQKVVDSFNGLDIVCLAAGIIDEINFEKMIQLNLTAVIMGSYMAIERMRKDRGGRGGIIINLASNAAFTEEEYLLVYSATKAGLVAFSKSLAAHLGDKETTGIQIGTVCPRRVDTDMVHAQLRLDPKYREKDITQPFAQERLVESQAEFPSNKEDWISAQRTADTLLKYMEEPDFHGSAIKIDYAEVEYVYPERIKGKKL